MIEQVSSAASHPPLRGHRSAKVCDTLYALAARSRGSGVAHHIEMQDFAPLMADNKEAVQDTKSDRGYREEVHRRNGVAMIS